MECSSCGKDISLSKNLKSPGTITSKTIEECPECGEEINKNSSLDDTVLEKGI